MSGNQEEIERLLGTASFMRWLEGNASAAESEQWKTWEEAEAKNKELADSLRKIHNNLGFLPATGLDIDGELKKLNQSIDSYSKVERLQALHAPRNSVRRAIPKIAAAILMLVVVSIVFKVAQSGFFDSNEIETVVKEYTITSTDLGELKILTLSDGSKITLNANSQLRFPSQSQNGDMEVWLKGEAYFQVNRLEGDQERTFKVHLDNGEVSVLGTTFNVNAYSDKTEVYLEEGSVKVDLIDQEQVLDTYLMKPGELSVWSPSSQKISTENANGEIYVSWTESKLVFDRSSLEEISKRLGHIYNVEFVFEQDQYKHLLISGSLPNNNLSVFINALEEILNQKVSLNENTVTIGE